MALLRVPLGGGDHLIVRVLRREAYRVPTNYWDANWLTCEIRIVLGPDAGKWGTSILTGEFESFRTRLEGLSAGTQASAQLETLEPRLLLTVEAAAGSVVTIRGEAARSGLREERIWRFERSDLPARPTVARLVEQLRGIASEYPVWDEVSGNSPEAQAGRSELP